MFTSRDITEEMDSVMYAVVTAKRRTAEDFHSCEQINTFFTKHSACKFAKVHNKISEILNLNTHTIVRKDTWNPDTQITERKFYDEQENEIDPNYVFEHILCALSDETANETEIESV